MVPVFPFPMDGSSRKNGKNFGLFRAGFSRVNYRGLRINVVNFSYVLKFFVAGADPGSEIQNVFDP
jgi:hypothetical protein